jgi:thioredoxin-dependent peroxiredoxin
MATAAKDKKVPAFRLPATGGKSLGLADFKGRKLVLYFYPKDDTPGCTLESQGFRDHYEAFTKAGADIIGVSRDSIGSHEKFKAKFELPFELASDPEEELCELFDVMREKNMYGRKVKGVERSTFLIDGEGVLRKEWRKVKVPGHVEEVLEAVKAL